MTGSESECSSSMYSDGCYWLIDPDPVILMYNNQLVISLRHCVFIETKMSLNLFI